MTIMSKEYWKKYNKKRKKYLHNYAIDYYKKNKDALKEYNKDRRLISYSKVKQIMKELKINGCGICGYNKSQTSLHFHHVEDKNKKFGVNTWSVESKSNKSVAEEINKCILLCCNCHGEIHDKQGGNL